MPRRGPKADVPQIQYDFQDSCLFLQSRTVLSLKNLLNVVKEKIRASYSRKKKESGFCQRCILNPG
jgi:hypothetical protein